MQLVTGFGTVTRRMHNKSFTVDNVMTIIGGRNIGDEYYDADPALEFADLDVLVIGDIVYEVSKSFDTYWNSSLAYPATTIIAKQPSSEKLQELKKFLQTFMEEQKTSDYLTALRHSELAQKIRNNDVTFYWGDATLVVDHAEKLATSRDDDEFHLVKQLEPYFDAIEKELIVISPYFVPGDEGVEYYKSLTDKGVHVKVLTNSLSSSDVSIVHAGYSNYRKALLRNGVELYEGNKKMTRAQRKQKKGFGNSSKASLHAKVFVLDRKQIFIGSLNLDPRSFYENSEIGLLISSSEIAQGIAESFDKNIDKESFSLELIEDEEGMEALLWHGYENGEPVTFDVDPYTSFWRRFAVGFLSLLPIESQL